MGRKKINTQSSTKQSFAKKRAEIKGTSNESLSTKELLQKLGRKIVKSPGYAEFCQDWIMFFEDPESTVAPVFINK